MTQLSLIFEPEIDDSRKGPYEAAPAVPMAYVRRGRPPKRTVALPIGTQQRFIDAAAAAATAGFPLNIMLTIRWNSLFSSNVVHQLRCMTAPDRIDRLVELLRHWLKWRGIRAFYIWVREAVPNEGKHWHIIFHLPPEHRREFVHQVIEWTGEDKRPFRRSPRIAAEGEFACGELFSWHLAGDTKPEHKGMFLAAYLGKGEPSQHLFHGKPRVNQRKPIRGRRFGGTQPDGKYDAAQGMIEGATHREDRFFISKHLQDLARSQRTG